jgi:hypothetical protein
MDWRLAMEQRAALKRIVALLFALADLAELACSRSPAARRFVLWLLRHAETVARDFITGAPETPPASMPVDPAGRWRADALHLAASFRALAWQLDRQARLAIASHGKGCGETGPPSFGLMQALRGLLNALSMLPGLAGRASHLAFAPDTS